MKHLHLLQMRSLLHLRRHFRLSHRQWLLLSLYLLLTSAIFAQTGNIQVKGTVVTAAGELLPGAVILIKGSTKGTTSRSDGSFELSVPVNSTIRVSYTGYIAQELSIDAAVTSPLSIRLSANNSDLNEVIVVGYGVQKKSDVTGSIVSINEKALKDVPVANISQALQGQGAGIDVQKNGGNSKPGSSPRILIRGTRSLRADNDPLFVVDGIPFNGNINDLNQDDVVSVEVLKDASSTAIYGSRGANGVILVTTRRGKAGKPVISYTGYGGFSSPRGKYPIMNGQQFADFKKWAIMNNNPGKYKGLDDPLWLSDQDNSFLAVEKESIRTGRSTDWQDLIYKNGMTTNHQLSVAGGSEQTQYAFSGGYFRETGIYPGQSFDRYTVKISVDQQFGKRFKIGINSLNTLSQTNGENANPMGQVLRANPLATPYNPDGSLVGFIPGNAAQVWNPLSNLIPGAVVEKRKRFGTFSTIYGEVLLANGLKYRINAGAEIRSNQYGNFTASNTTNNLGGPSRARNENTYSTNYTVENVLTYDKTFAQKHKINFTGLYSFQQYQMERTGFGNSNVAIDELQYFNPQYGAFMTGDGDQEKWTILSYMGRLNYSFKDRYLISFTVRSDGSSRLAPGSKYDIFPSGAVAWNIIQEPFMRSLKNVSNLKLRATYGKVGNTAIQAYQTLGALSPMTYNYGNLTVVGAYQTSIPNPNLTWEYTATFNLGLDFGLFDNRISGNIEFYKAATSSLLLQQNLPATSGIPTAILRNIGKTENKGIEIQLSTINIQGKGRNDFNWSTDLNFFINRGKIRQLADGVQNDISNSWFVGQPIGTIYGYKRVGIWQATPADSALAKALSLTVNTKDGVIGTIRVDDVNGDKKINGNDRIFLGSGQPKWEGGMTNRFSYRGFDLTVVAFARIGSTLVSRMHQSGSFINTFQSNYNNLNIHYWTPNNSENYYPRPFAGSTNTPYSELLSYFDGSFLKIRSLSLAYSLPPSWLRNMGAKSFRIYATAEEPFILFSEYVNKYGGLDPESAGTLGVDTPPMRSYVFGVNMTF